MYYYNIYIYITGSFKNYVSLLTFISFSSQVQACAINHIQVDSFQQENTRETLIMEYINCLMQGVFPDQPYDEFARRCADETKVQKFDSILNCANSTEGSKYLEQMGEFTYKLQNPLKNVPTITVRESFDGAIQSAALTDLSATVCKNLPKPMPAVCRAYSGATSLMTIGVTGITLIATILMVL